MSRLPHALPSPKRETLRNSIVPGFDQWPLGGRTAAHRVFFMDLPVYSGHRSCHFTAACCEVVPLVLVPPAREGPRTIRQAAPATPPKVLAYVVAGG